MKKHGEKVVKTRAGWHKADQVKRIKIVMTMIAVALSISICAGSLLAWIQIKRPFDSSSSGAKANSAAVSDEEEVLPVYDNTYNLLLINAATPLKPDFTVSLQKIDGISLDERILPALREMMKDAEKAGCALKLTGGYVDAKEQDKLYQVEVQSLKKKGYSQVKAENQAQTTVGRGGYNEKQTGMSVQISAEGLASGANFASTAQYKWLKTHSVEYGFVVRYPEDKTDITGTAFNPGYYRYVGTENAVKLREYGMCLEEYAGYIHKQSTN